MCCDTRVTNEPYSDQASEWTAQERWFNSQQVHKIFLLSRRSRPTGRPIESLIQRAADWIPLGRKAEGKITWSCIPLLLCIIHWAKLSITRDRGYMILITRFLISLSLWKKAVFHFRKMPFDTQDKGLLNCLNLLKWFLQASLWMRSNAPYICAPT